MTETNNELNQGVDADALNGLPEGERAETQKILDEIAGETTPAEGEKKPEAADKPKVLEDEKPKETDGEKPVDLNKNKPEPRREVKLMPAYIHEIQKAQFEKREKELLAEIEKAKGASTIQGEEKPAEGQGIQQSEIDTFAEKHNLTPELAKDLLEMANKNNGKLPDEVTEKLKVVDEMRNSATVAAEATAFNADFDKIILPLIKTEYGDDVPASMIDQIREELKAKAYTPEYAKVPYTTLYKGEDQFRGLVAPVKKGAEGGRGGTTAQQDIAGQGEQIDLTKPVSDEVLRTLTDAQFAEYEKNMETFERSK